MNNPTDQVRGRCFLNHPPFNNKCEIKFATSLMFTKKFATEYFAFSPAKAYLNVNHDISKGIGDGLQTAT